MGSVSVYLCDPYCVLIISYFKSHFILSFTKQQLKERFLENIPDFYLQNPVKFCNTFSVIINIMV